MRSSALLRALSSRELSPRNLHGSPGSGDLTSDATVSGSGIIDLDSQRPPLAVSFSKERANGHLLAVADEEGFVRVFDTRQQLLSQSDYQGKTGKVGATRWLAHNNAVFDIQWSLGDAHMFTASGDQTIKVWDTEDQTEIGRLRWHTGSVKALSMHPFHPGLFVSGSRDGNVALWDVRQGYQQPVSWITNAHSQQRGRRKATPRKACINSVTAVLYLGDEKLFATAGAADGVVKFWDTRNLKKQLVQTPPQQDNSDKSGRMHGFTSLSMDSFGVNIIASSRDKRIYMYSAFQPHKGLLRTFSGHTMQSFYVKAVLSPDGTHILSGSGDGNAFVWQVDKPQDPLILQGHKSEVTAVAWCPTENFKLATCSDDFTVRIWTARGLSSLRHRACCHYEHAFGATHAGVSDTSSPAKSEFTLNGDANEEKSSKSVAGDSPVSVLSTPRYTKKQRRIDQYLMAA